MAQRISITVSTLAFACLTVCAGSGSAATRTVRAVKPPVIHEVFSVLPCPRSKAQSETTIGVEGCQEQTIVRSDRKIDALAKLILPRLSDAAAQHRFVTGERAWLAYRTAFCNSQSDLYEGGTAAPLAYASCAITVNSQHLEALTAFHKNLLR
jgi:uncharacterized protein YecT (DUF1311 family)